MSTHNLYVCRLIQKSFTNLVFALMGLVLSIAAVDGVKVRFKFPVRSRFREAAEAMDRAKRIMAAAECADTLLYNTHAPPQPH